ncbi:MAG: hypothetical protein C7B45_14120 [Sulfobacillus acidophilus]|uniref:Uncharacterized protein n=1 Tax=Sulfobacillus acidophilus TaxID=53633 RepID=A0A2T2WEH7_9FIRM|nr:MAG: hypothetical protein C7B45_14120 [Sulfobacillus acidophilus]
MDRTYCGFCGDQIGATPPWIKDELYLCCDCLIELEPMIHTPESKVFAQSKIECDICHETRFSVVENPNHSLRICMGCLQQAVGEMRDRGLLNKPGQLTSPPGLFTLPEQVRKALEECDVDPLWRQILSHRWAVNGDAWTLHELHQKFLPTLSMREFHRQLRQWESYIMSNQEK